MQKLLLLLIIPLFIFGQEALSGKVSVHVDLGYPSEGIPHVVVVLMNIHNQEIFHIDFECWEEDCWENRDGTPTTPHVYFNNIPSGIYIAFYVSADKRWITKNKWLKKDMWLEDFDEELEYPFFIGGYNYDVAFDNHLFPLGFSTNRLCPFLIFSDKNVINPWENIVKIDLPSPDGSEDLFDYISINKLKSIIEQY